MFLSTIKRLIVTFIPPRIYWTLAGFVHPLSAAIEGQRKDAEFYKLGNDELNIFKKLNVLKKGMRTLEIGCGPGRIQHALSQSGLNLEVHGTDFSSSMVHYAKKRVPQAHFTVGSGRDLKQYTDAAFDFIYSFVVFQHVNEEIFNAYLCEIHRILKNGGMFIFQIQSSEGMANYERPRHHPWLLRHYRREEIVAKLQNASFRNIELYDMRGNKNPLTVDASGFLFTARK